MVSCTNALTTLRLKIAPSQSTKTPGQRAALSSSVPAQGEPGKMSLPASRGPARTPPLAPGSDLGRSNSRPCPVQGSAATPPLDLAQKGRERQRLQGKDDTSLGGAGELPPVPCPSVLLKVTTSSGPVWPATQAPWPSSHQSVLWQFSCCAARLVSLPTGSGKGWLRGDVCAVRAGSGRGGRSRAPALAMAI